MTLTLTSETAIRFAEIALGHVTREYPHKLDHVMNGPEDVLSPSQLHPIFHGSFDWHSCVHGYWLLLRIRRLFPDLSVARRIEALADTMLTAAKVNGEVDYLDRAYSGGFSRPYGWAWAIALWEEAARHDDRDWGANLSPLAERLADLFKGYLARLTYPIRVGTHFNSAFALTLARGWPDEALHALIADKARSWFAGDRDCQAWEPGGDEFLSSALTEALLMRRVLGDDFSGWFADFLPRVAKGEPHALLEPAFVSDRSDGKIAHLDGCNLSRAWCWREIASALPEAVARIAHDAADRHLAASLPHVAGDYMGEHWLATYAMLAMEAG
jgi:Protein of unknown function (DUF2891)